VCPPTSSEVASQGTSMCTRLTNIWIRCSTGSRISIPLPLLYLCNQDVSHNCCSRDSGADVVSRDWSLHWHDSAGRHDQKPAAVPPWLVNRIFNGHLGKEISLAFCLKTLCWHLKEEPAV
jgi:hypothetical protein